MVRIVPCTDDDENKDDDQENDRITAYNWSHGHMTTRPSNPKPTPMVVADAVKIQPNLEDAKSVDDLKAKARSLCLTGTTMSTRITLAKMVVGTSKVLVKATLIRAPRLAHSMASTRQGQQRKQ